MFADLGHFNRLSIQVSRSLSFLLIELNFSMLTFINYFNQIYEPPSYFSVELCFHYVSLLMPFSVHFETKLVMLLNLSLVNICSWLSPF